MRLLSSPRLECKDHFSLQVNLAAASPQYSKQPIVAKRIENGEACWSFDGWFMRQKASAGGHYFPAYTPNDVGVLSV